MKNQLRKLRESRGYSQSALADMVGVRQHRISEWESGTRDMLRVQADTMLALTRALRCTLGQLLGAEKISE